MCTYRVAHSMHLQCKCFRVCMNVFSFNDVDSAKLKEPFRLHQKSSYYSIFAFDNN